MSRSIVSRTGKIVLACAAVGLLVAGCIWLPIGSWVVDTVGWIRELGPLGLLVFSVVFMIVCLLPLPSFELYVAAGLLYGTWWGALLTTGLGILVELCTLWLVHTRLRGGLERRIQAHPRLAALDRAISEHSFSIVQLLRLSPLIPFGLLNYALALTKMPLWKRLVTNVLGKLPMGLAQAYLGSLLSGVGGLGERTQAPWEHVALGIGLGTAIAATALTGWATHRVLGREHHA